MMPIKSTARPMSQVQEKALRRARRNLAVNICLARMARGLTQNQLADSSGIMRHYVQRIEQSDRELHFTTIYLISRHLRIPIEDLLADPIPGWQERMEKMRRLMLSAGARNRRTARTTQCPIQVSLHEHWIDCTLPPGHTPWLHSWQRPGARPFVSAPPAARVRNRDGGPAGYPWDDSPAPE